MIISYTCMLNAFIRGGDRNYVIFKKHFLEDAIQLKPTMLY